jgi:hypothetical protein
LLLTPTVFVGSAGAAVTHEFLPGVSEKISEGVPVGCGAKEPEPSCVSGALSGVNAMTVDEGHVWVAEHVEGQGFGSWVDEFDGRLAGLVVLWFACQDLG